MHVYSQEIPSLQYLVSQTHAHFDADVPCCRGVLTLRLGLSNVMNKTISQTGYRNESAVCKIIEPKSKYSYLEPEVRKETLYAGAESRHNSTRRFSSIIH